MFLMHAQFCFCLVSVVNLIFVFLKVPVLTCLSSTLSLDWFYVCQFCLCRNGVFYYFFGTHTVGEMRRWEGLLTSLVSIRPVIVQIINAYANTFANTWQQNREASWNFWIFYIGWRCLIVIVALINQVEWNFGGFLYFYTLYCT